MRIEDLPTPAFVVDRRRFRDNCETARRKVARRGAAFRPHVKTHKTVEGALLQHGGSRGPVTVSTIAEAEFFADAGFADVTYAVPIDPGKLERAARLAHRIRLHLLIDTPQAFAAIEEFTRSNPVRFSLFLKVDSGAARAGVDPSSPDSFALARALAASTRIEFRGLLTHAGHSYRCRSQAEILAVAEEEAAILTRFRDAAGLPAILRSVGATPTVSVPDELPDADEFRPGNYVFYDAYQAAIGSCDLRDCAASVVVSVISAHPRSNKLLVDGGALALSKDPGPIHVEPDCGYGVVTDLGGRPLPMRLFSISQEHGQIAGTAPIAFDRHPIGSKLRIVPNHSCLTAAMFDRYEVVEGEEVVDQWRPVRGW